MPALTFYLETGLTGSTKDMIKPLRINSNTILRLTLHKKETERLHNFFEQRRYAESLNKYIDELGKYPLSAAKSKFNETEGDVKFSVDLSFGVDKRRTSYIKIN